MKRAILAVLSIFVLTLNARAQEPRKPGAEEARIGYFAGRWTIEFDIKMSAGGKSTASETCTWFVGGFHLICRAEGTGLFGAFTQLATIGYDPVEKTYTYYEINSSGAAMLNRGTVSGPVWTWLAETIVEGKRMRGRTTTTQQSPTSYVARFETSVDGGPWTVVWESKASKMQ